MVPSISERRLVILFMEGLLEPLRGWVKAFDPPTLLEAMKKVRNMELAAPRSKFPSKFSSNKESKFPHRKDEKSDIKNKFPMGRN